MSRAGTGRIVSRRVRRLTAIGQAEVGKVLDAVQRAEWTRAAMRDIAASCSSQPVSSPPASLHDRRPRSVGVGLTAVNAAAVVPIVALSGPTTETPDASEIGVAVLLAVLLAVGQLAFAVALGRKLQEVGLAATTAPRLPGRRLDGAVPLEGVALALLSTLVGWVIYLWTWTRLSDDHAQLGVLLGLALALQAWIAPWLVVAAAAGAQPGRTRRLAMVGRRIDELAAAWEGDRSIAFRALISARSALHRADHIVACAAESSDRPIRASWSYALRQLGAAIADAEARYAALVSGPGGTPSGPPGGPLGRDGVDLVG